jgi:hypothetical protein
MSDIFKENPKLEKYYGTSDGEAFYNENDAKNYAKKLEDKTVEPVYNTNFLEVEGSVDLSEEQKELLEFEAAEKLAADKSVFLEGEGSVDLSEEQKELLEFEAAEKLAADKSVQDIVNEEKTAKAKITK